MNGWLFTALAVVSLLAAFGMGIAIGVFGNRDDEDPWDR